jgi:hypothetical protein
MSGTEALAVLNLAYKLLESAQKHAPIDLHREPA